MSLIKATISSKICQNKNCDSSKLDKRRLKTKVRGTMVMVTSYVLQASIDFKKKLFAVLFVRQKGFNREGPEERVEIEEDVHIVEWLSKFIKVKLFRIWIMHHFTSIVVSFIYT